MFVRGSLRNAITFAVLLSFSCALCSEAAGTPIRLKLAGKDLALFDPLNGLPDAYVNVSYAYGSSEDYENLGQTKVISDNQNPSWNETFNIDFVPGTSQRLRLDVWDSDFDEDDFMGRVDIFLSEVNNAVAQPIEKYFLGTPENGRLLIQNIA